MQLRSPGLRAVLLRGRSFRYRNVAEGSSHERRAQGIARYHAGMSFQVAQQVVCINDVFSPCG
jgi:hypothetical protein